MASNKLYYGDNLHVLREFVASNSVDLIYLDPPFNSKQDYNILFKTPVGAPASAQIEAFGDTWHWGEEAERAYDEVLCCGNTQLADMVTAFEGFLKKNDVMAYLVMMAIRLVELNRVLKPTGSIFLHCDSTASHYLKLVMDAIFGVARYRNEIIWRRSHAHSDGKQGARHLGRVTDTILFYANSEHSIWNVQYQPYDPGYVDRDYRRKDPNGRRYRLDNIQGPGGAEKGNPFYEVMGVWRHWRYSKEKMDRLIADGRIVQTRTGAVPQYKRYLDEMPGVPLQNLWDDMPCINNRSKEFLGYQTQKPLALLERIIKLASNPGDVVLDPFCGCGTAIDAAETLGRRWVGIDITYLAIGLIERRLRRRHGGAGPVVLGAPRDLESAAHLARTDPYQFQWWAVSKVDAQPFGGRRKGADGGVDGVIYFRSASNRTERAIVSVKGGENVGVGAVKELRATIEGERSPIGVLITLKEPNSNMEREAARAGFTDQEHGAVPRLQLLSVRDLLQGKRPRIPLIDVGAAYRQASRHVRAAEQEELAI